jgi:hypothetical protein
MYGEGPVIAAPLALPPHKVGRLKTWNTTYLPGGVYGSGVPAGIGGSFLSDAA